MALKKNKKEKTISGLLNFIQTESYIECTKCGAVEGGGFDDEESLADVVYSDGWRVTSFNCYCPKCSKKILNKQQFKKVKISIDKNGKTEIKNGKKTIGKQG